MALPSECHRHGHGGTATISAVDRHVNAASIVDAVDQLIFGVYALD
jgi:hypothetical protein